MREWYSIGEIVELEDYNNNPTLKVWGMRRVGNMIIGGYPNTLIKFTIMI